MPVTAVKNGLKKLKRPIFVRRFSQSKQQTAGLPPGHLVHVGEKKTEEVKFSIIDYNERSLKEKQTAEVKHCFPFSKTKTVTWINITGLHDISKIETLGECFNLHPLLMEDLLNTDQRPKLEDFEDYLFIVLKMLTYDGSSKSIVSEQISLVLGRNFVLSFQETEGDVFDSVRSRIRNSKGRFRKSGADYLLYALIDSIVDNYFVIMENAGEQIEDLEEALTADPKSQYLPELHRLKREAIFLRKSVWPLREVISGLQRADSKLIKKETQLYLRDVYDHTIQVIDNVETFRDMLAGILDLYLSGMSNKMNEIMKVLTVFAAIFIPLTFVAGVYGMNFEYMPELTWRYGYFYVLGFMGLVTAELLGFFKIKKWL